MIQLLQHAVQSVISPIVGPGRVVPTGRLSFHSRVP